jgi:hypothetical protein
MTHRGARHRQNHAAEQVHHRPGALSRVVLPVK